MAGVDVSRMRVTSTLRYGLGATEDANSAAHGNAAALRSRAASAITANSAFLALTAPTPGQLSAQIQLLTKECSGLIRLLIGALDDIAGT